MLQTTKTGPSPDRSTAPYPPDSIPDWLKCINCKVPARGGRIAHRPTCPDWTPPRRTNGTATTAVRQYSVSEFDDARSRYERFVARLTERRRDRYDCPSCGARGDGHGLWVTLEGDRIRFHCFACRGADEILAALRLDWSWIHGERRAA